MENLTLYDISEAYSQVISSELPPEKITQLLESITDNAITKIGNIGLLTESIDANIDTLKEHNNKIKLRQKNLENKKKKLKQYVLENMQRMDKKKIETPFVNVTRVKTGAVVVIDSEMEIPDKYFRTKTSVTVDKKSILDDYKATGLGIKGVVIDESNEFIKIHIANK